MLMEENIFPNLTVESRLCLWAWWRWCSVIELRPNETLIQASSCDVTTPAAPAVAASYFSFWYCHPRLPLIRLMSSCLMLFNIAYRPACHAFLLELDDRVCLWYRDWQNRRDELPEMKIMNREKEMPMQSTCMWRMERGAFELTRR